MTDYISCDRCGTSVEVPQQATEHEDERTSFESWAEDHSYPTHKIAGQYVNRFTQSAWAGWQARAPRTAQHIAATATAVRQRRKDLANSLHNTAVHAHENP